MNYLIIEGQKRRIYSPVWSETDLRKLKNILFVSLFSLGYNCFTRVCQFPLSFLFLFCVCFLMLAFITMNFPLRVAFVPSHKFWQIVFPFSLVSKYFLILIWFLFDTFIFILVNLPKFNFFLVLDSSIATFGEGNGTPLQYSCLENPMDRGAW